MASQDQIAFISRATFICAVIATAVFCPGSEKGATAAPAPDATAKATPARKFLTYEFPTRADLGTIEVFAKRPEASKSHLDPMGKQLMRGRIMLPEGQDVGITLSYYGLENLKALMQLTRGVRVTQINAARLEMDDSQAEFLKNFPAIVRANFDNTLITDKTLVNLKGLKGLDDLRLSATDVTGSAFNELDGKPLKIFNISGINLKPGSLAKIKSLPATVVEMNCSKVRLSPADFAFLCKCTKLISLDIDGNSQINDAIVGQLASLKNLYALNIADTKVTEKSLPMLSRMPALRELTVRDNSFWLVKPGKSPRPTLKIVDTGGKARTPADLFEPLH